MHDDPPTTTTIEGSVAAAAPIAFDDDNQSTSQSTTLSELVRQLRGQLNVDKLEERFRDEEDVVEVGVAPVGPSDYNDMDYFVHTPQDNYESEEGARDFETVSSISRMSAITDVILLSDPELGAGRILALDRPQPDEATIERPMPPGRRSPDEAPYTTISPMHSDGACMEPPVRTIVAMGPVKDDPSFETITFGDGVIKVRRNNKRRCGTSSDKSTNDEDSTKEPSCDASNDSFPPPLIPWRRIFLLLTFAFMVGGLAAYVPALLKSPDKPRGPPPSASTLPEKQTMDREDSSDSEARDTDIFLTASPTSSAVPTPALTDSPTTVSPTVVSSEGATTSPIIMPTASPTASPSTPTPTQPTASPTARPSSSPTTLQEGIDAVLAAPGFTNIALTRVPSSPHNLAYQFILQTTRFDKHSPQQVRQRYIMALFYYATGGDGWEHRMGWMEASDECQWYSGDASPCNEQGELVSLSLPGNNLIGEIPRELGFLSTLEEIELRGNDLVGEIPDTLGRLQFLADLDLSWTQLDGLIPSSLSQAASLKRINLVSTALHGPIPLEFGQLTDLEELLLVKTNLTGSMPEVVCALRQQSLVEVWADCDAVECPCCNYCCYEGQIEICQTV